MDRSLPEFRRRLWLHDIVVLKMCRLPELPRLNGAVCIEGTHHLSFAGCLCSSVPLFLCSSAQVQVCACFLVFYFFHFFHFFPLFSVSPRENTVHSRTAVFKINTRQKYKKRSDTRHSNSKFFSRVFRGILFEFTVYSCTRMLPRHALDSDFSRPPSLFCCLLFLALFFFAVRVLYFTVLFSFFRTLRVFSMFT